MRNKSGQKSGKEFLVFSVFCFLLCILLAGCGKREIRNINSQGKNIICFGDSLTCGYGANSGEDYPSALVKLVNFPIINAGVDGDTTFAALGRLENDVLAKNPRLVIVEFCGNDFLKKVTRETTVKNLGEIIDRIQAHGAMVALVDISAGFFFRDYRIDFEKLAVQKKAIFIPVVLNKIITNPAMKSDFFHPNARGYRVIAQRVCRAISAYIK